MSNGSILTLSHVLSLPGSAVPPPLSPPGAAALYFDGIDLLLSENGGPYLPIASVPSAGGWTDTGTHVRLTTLTDTVSVGTAAAAAAEKLLVAGGGGADGMTLLSDPADPKAVIEMDGGDNAAVSAAGRGRLRFSAGSLRWEISENGGPWTAISVAGGSGWTDDGPTVRLTTAGDLVAVGQLNALGHKLRVAGTVQHDLNVANEWIQHLTQDAYSRYQIWGTMPDSVFRLGAAISDGDAFDADSEGIVVYETSSNYLGRIKPNRMGLTRCTDSSLYYWRADDTRFFYRADPPGGAVHFYIDRATGFVGIGTDTPIAGELCHVAGDLSLASDVTLEDQGGLLHYIQGVQPAGNGSQNSDALNIRIGTGQDNAAGAAGPGGFFRVNAGRGGACTSGADNGSAGGDCELFAGYGGGATGGGNTAGIGGNCDLVAGNGGTGSSGADGGRGGAVFVRGGQGGNGTNPGNGGDVWIEGGNGWPTAGNNDGGKVYIQGGQGQGTGSDGLILIGNADTYEIYLANAADNPRTYWTGTGWIDFNSLARIEPSDGGSIWGAVARDASALVQIDTTTKGFLPPRMTRDQRNLIAAPATGLEVHDTSRSGSLDFYDGTQWREVAPPIDGGLQTGPVAYSANIDEIIRCAPALGIPTITLPTAVGCAMRAITVKEVTGSASPININTTGGQTIDGVAGPPADTIAAAYGAATYISDGANWMKFT